jgi:hypothetical protein
MPVISFSQQVVGLVINESISIHGVQGSTLTNGMGCGQRWNVD